MILDERRAQGRAGEVGEGWQLVHEGLAFALKAQRGQVHHVAPVG